MTERTASGSGAASCGGVSAAVTGVDHPPVSRQQAPSARSGKTAHVPLLGTTVSLDDEADLAFVTDCVRYTEGLRTDQQLRETWARDQNEWILRAENASLLNAVSYTHLTLPTILRV